VGPELLADSVDEQFDPPASSADIDIEVLAIREQLTDLAEKAPTRSFVEFLGAYVLQLLVAPRTGHRIHVH
jgi:hypothetical protein